ncbi:MAG: hypothetical protein GC193_08780 [Cryomorphaceae bacterium]|nr:hypothetical protein [Cryomorphaceae bacterium]
MAFMLISNLNAHEGCFEYDLVIDDARTIEQMDSSDCLKIESLWIHDDLMEEIPNSIIKFRNLKKLSLDYSINLMRIDSVFIYFPKLTYLNVSLTRVKELPSYDREEKELKVLVIRKTGIIQLPEGLTSLLTLDAGKSAFDCSELNKVPMLQNLAINGDSLDFDCLNFLRNSSINTIALDDKYSSITSLNQNANIQQIDLNEFRKKKICALLSELESLQKY